MRDALDTEIIANVFRPISMAFSSANKGWADTDLHWLASYIMKYFKTYKILTAEETI